MAVDKPSLEDQLAEAERRNGLPAGVLKSVMHQETGGKADYLTDPSKYHYELNSEGKRIAGHTGQVSTAFGPFGILESTGKAPGFGVAPLKDKSLGEQIRFAADYLGARVKSAGSLEAGLAGYGEGQKYSAQVLRRMGTAYAAGDAVQGGVPAVAPKRQIAAETPTRPEGWPVLPTAQRPTNAAKTAVPDGREALLAQSNAQAVAGLSSASVSQMETAAGIAAEADLQKQRDATGISDVLYEARRDSRIQPLFGLIDYINQEKEIVPEGWSYAAIRDEEEANKTSEEREYLHENNSGPKALARAQAQIAYRREQDKVYGLAGGFSSFAGQMAGGAMDPVGFTLGMGVGKVLQGVGIGSAALASAGRVGAARTSFLAENALANVGVEAVQDAMGEVKTSADYALAGATGVGMALPFVRGAGLTAADAAVRELTDSIKTQAVREQVEQVATHMDQTGNKDPLAAAKAVQDNELREIARAVDEATRPNPIRDQVVPTELADEFRRIQEGEPAKVPAVEEPTRLPDEPAPVKAVDADAATNPDSRQLPQLFTEEQLATQVESIKTKGEFSRELPSKDGNGVTLSFFTKLEKRPAPDKNTFSSKEVLQRISEIGSDVDRRQAKYFLERLSSSVLEVPVRFSTARKHGVFEAGKEHIGAPSASEGGLDAALGKVSGWHQATVLHEIGHAATHSKIQAFLDNPTGVTKGLQEALAQMQDLHKRYKAEVAQRFPQGATDTASYNADYSTKNLHEFAAQIWSDKTTRDILQGMEGKAVAGKSSNAWREMINTLAKILGFSGKDAYTEGSKLLDLVLSADGSNIHYMGGEKALQAPGQVPPQAQASFARKYAEGLYNHAKQFVSQNPIDTRKLQTLTAKIGGLSDGLVLAGSKNPIMQMVASLVTETTTGAAGRKANVAIRSHMLNKKLMGNTIPDYDGAYTVWAKANGGGVWDDVMSGAKKREFNTAVYDEILNRRDPSYQPSADANVLRAADSLEQFFDRSRVAQVDAGTLGSNNLAASSRGYIPQAMDGSKLQALDVSDLNLVHQTLSRQFQDRLGWDAKFADMFAPYYTDRIRKRSQGSDSVDALSAGGDGGQVVRDTLDEMGLDPTMRDRAAAANAMRSGMGHTKKRLDLDLREELRPGLRLADVYVTDPLALARSYGRRTAGTVALTESGIHGIRGVRQLRDAAGVPVETGTTPTTSEFDAFDRVMAEILGTPVAGQVVSAGATNLALGVSLQRLGGLIFTQAAETFQLIHHLGLRSALDGITSLPKMLGEVGRLKKGQASNNHILTSIEQYGGEIGTDSYKMVAPLDAPDSRVEQYMEQAGVLSRLLRGGGHLQSKISGFRGLMAAQHRMAAEQITMKAARFIRDGGEDIALRDMGFTPEVVASMKADLGNVAKWDSAGRLQSFDLTQVSDPRTAEAFVQAVHRGTSQIIQGSFIGERNKWMHNDYLRLMLQLRTFGLTAVEKQWGRTRMNHSYTYAAGMLLGQMALVLPIHMARVNLAAAGREDREKYLKDNLSPAALVRATMNYTSLSGLAGDVLEIGSGIAAGWGDQQTKEMLGARQQATGVGRTVPIAGSIDTAIRVASGKSDLHTALKQLPFSNLWYIAPAINLTKD